MTKYNLLLFYYFSKKKKEGDKVIFFDLFINIDLKIFNVYLIILLKSLINFILR